MIVVADINTIWRRKPFEALAKKIAVLGLAPRDIFMALRNPHLKKATKGQDACFRDSSVVMPPGWASKFQGWTARRLWASANREAKKNGGRLKALFVTSPHYLPLIKRAGIYIPTFYYCSDDYAQYEGWGGRAVLDQEAELVKSVTHSFFVSRPLAERAIRDYGVAAANVSVSQNATEQIFLDAVPGSVIDALVGKFPKLRRPLVGVIGGVNDRLEAELLLSVAEHQMVGSLVMVGPVAPDLSGPFWTRLHNHPKCQFIGAQPHKELPFWMQAIDVALIPYCETPLNRSCSPMRLYDHLAAGKPIVATDHCQQISEYEQVVALAKTPNMFLEKLSRYIAEGDCAHNVLARKEIGRSNLWENRAEQIASYLYRYIG